MRSLALGRAQQLLGWSSSVRGRVLTLPTRALSRSAAKLGPVGSAVGAPPPPPVPPPLPPPQAHQRSPAQAQVHQPVQHAAAVSSQPAASAAPAPPPPPLPPPSAAPAAAISQQASLFPGPPPGNAPAQAVGDSSRPAQRTGAPLSAAEQYERLKHFLPLPKEPDTPRPLPEALKPGFRLRVEWSNGWWAARVSEEREDSVKVSFDTWSTQYDEWIARDSQRLRLPLPDDVDTKAEGSQMPTWTPPPVSDASLHNRPFVPKPYNPEKEFQKRQLRLRDKIAQMQQAKFGEVDPALQALRSRPPRDAGFAAAVGQAGQAPTLQAAPPSFPPPAGPGLQAADELLAQGTSPPWAAEPSVPAAAAIPGPPPASATPAAAAAFPGPPPLPATPKAESPLPVATAVPVPGASAAGFPGPPPLPGAAAAFPGPPPVSGAAAATFPGSPSVPGAAAAAFPGPPPVPEAAPAIPGPPPMSASAASALPKSSLPSDPPAAAAFPGPPVTAPPAASLPGPSAKSEPAAADLPGPPTMARSDKSPGVSAAPSPAAAASPAGSPPPEQPGSAKLAPVVRWEEVLSDDKERFYHEVATGRTQWELPSEGWVALLDDDGSIYYWDPVVGTTTWDRPER
eukprot:TRINITY_DN52289_c0_g1_i1.p1 TRINITY_DN52289_c0_g1~~TRINITY_DN52289_c0_g1_i1.p1  ORF type:complete len:624 (-),score=149.35 TRINITY_DN52289_c0_g1_i1:87-1958(-)